MASRKGFYGVLVAVLALGFSAAGCLTASSIGGTAESHGLISKAKVVTDGGEEIASYSVILGLVDSKYPEYAAAVQAAIASGKKITTVTKWMVFLTKTTAYADAVVTVAPKAAPAEEAPAEDAPAEEAAQ